MEAWFISDIHIKTMQERNSQTLLRFLHSLGKKDPKNIHLFLLGDIFDLWIGGHSIFVDKFRPLVDAIKKLKYAGVQITYIEGNHDVHIDRFWTKELGISVYVDPQYVTVNGLTLRLEHGDLINLEDRTYLRYRSVIRHPWVEMLGHLIPGRVWEGIGTYAARKSRIRSHEYRSLNEGHLVEMIRTHAHRAYKENRFDAIISGHMHVFDEYNFNEDGLPVRSFNLGSWYGETIKVLKLSDRTFEWVAI